MKRLPVLVLAALCACLGWAVKPQGTIPGPHVIRADTVPPAALLREIGELRRESEGLRARLAGAEARPPRVIVRTDTLVQPPDTVFLPLLSMSRRARLTIPVLLADSAGWRPELWRGFDTGGCDDGWTVQDGVLVCDRARLGHLGLALGSEAVYDSRIVLGANLGVLWQPAYRSPWLASLTIGTDGRTRTAVTRQWRLF